MQTPATCANIGIHNIYPNEIDLVVCVLSCQEFVVPNSP